MPFKDYDQVADGLKLPVRGTVYDVPEMTVSAGIRVRRWADAVRSGDDHEPMTDETLGRLVLGTVYDQMVADDVPQGALRRAVQTALTDALYGREAAQRAWAGDTPKAPAPASNPTRARSTRRPASGTTQTKKNH